MSSNGLDTAPRGHISPVKAVRYQRNAAKNLLSNAWHILPFYYIGTAQYPPCCVVALIDHLNLKASK